MIGVGACVCPVWLGASTTFAQPNDPRDPPPSPVPAAENRYDWAVLHAGLEPRLGTFGGIATLALVDGDAERFYGGLRFSGAKDSATLFVGGVQLAPYFARAWSLYGVGQLAVAHAHANRFRGAFQATLGYARAGTFMGGLQFGPVASARVFTGGAQVGLVSWVDRRFEGLLQVGAVVAIGDEMFETTRNDAACAREDDFTGVAQIGLVASTRGRFIGLAQVGGVLWNGGSFYAPFQIGLTAIATDFKGLVQAGVLSGGDNLRGLGIGGLVIALRATGAQMGVATYAGEYTGLQLGVANISSKTGRGAQLGLVNVAERVRGVQIGLMNLADNLSGVQIGLANHARTGAILPWSPILNIGFGGGANADSSAPETPDVHHEPG